MTSNQLRDLVIVVTILSSLGIDGLTRIAVGYLRGEWR